jgi:hypothetical protein
MKSDEKVIAEASRMEYESNSGKLYIVFEITDPKYKEELKKNWTSSDLEFRIIDKKLIVEASPEEDKKEE